MFDDAAPCTAPAWYSAAACRGTPQSWFYPERGESLEPARALCATCPVILECGDASIDEHYGIWAGRSEQERRERPA